MKKKCTMLLAIMTSIMTCHAQVPENPSLKLSGGIELSRGNIQRDVLLDIIQSKQEEIFTRVFANTVVRYFNRHSRNDGISNFPVYYCLYSIMTDLTVGKSKTTVSKAVVTSSSELAYIYSFARYYQLRKISGRTDVDEKFLINNLSYIKEPTQRTPKIPKSNEDEKGENSNPTDVDSEKIKTTNIYMDAAFHVLAKNPKAQQLFRFKRSIDSPELSLWYADMLPPDSIKVKPAVGNHLISFSELVDDMTSILNDFLEGNHFTDDDIKAISQLQKDQAGFKDSTLTKKSVNSMKLILLDFANTTDAIFTEGVVKTLLNMLVENMHIELSEDLEINQVYIDVEGLILSLDKEFVSKHQRKKVFTPFLTIGTSLGFFLSPNELGAKDDNGNSSSLYTINYASEKIGFRIKLWNGGYRRSLGPGEAYKFAGSTYTWVKPQVRPVIDNVYINIYGSGILYNVLDLKTDENFDFGLIGTNLGITFFNGLELSCGFGYVYDRGFSNNNTFFKIDFDIPIVEYIAALRKKQ